MYLPKPNQIISILLVLGLISCSSNSVNPSQTPTPSDRQTIDVEDFHEIPKVETETREVSLILPGTDEEITVSVEVLEGLYLLEGDIVVGEESQIDIQAVGVNKASRLWPDALVPYVIDSSLSSRKQDIDKAIAEWNTKTTITLIPLSQMPSNKQTDYVSFRKVNHGCSSKIGRAGGKQYINLSSGCTAGTIIHEIGHAVGLFHEQARSNRDEFITVIEENIKPGKFSQFKPHDELAEGWGKDLGSETDYDYNSIMHYPWYAFSKSCDDKSSPDCKATILPKGTIDKNLLGQRIGLSEADIAGVAELYPKPKTVTITEFIATPDGGPSPLTTTFSWSVTNPNASSALACSLDTDSDGTAEYRFDCLTQTSQEHTYVILDAHKATLSVKDGDKPEVTDFILVSVEATGSDINQAPTVQAGPDQTVDFKDANFVSLAGSANDDGLPDPPASLTTLWSKKSGPGNVSFGDASDPETSVSFSESGNYVLVLTADDSAITASDQLSITVREAAPEITSFNYVGDDNENGRIELNEYAFFTASAKSGVPGPYTWSFAPDPVSFEQIDRSSPEDSGALSFKVAFASVGNKDVCIQVKDLENQASEEVCRVITVTANPTGPVSGIWATTYGDMQFYGNGTGEYTSDSGKLQFSLSGSVMTGIWIEPSSAQECDSDRGGSNYWGKFEFIFDDIFSSFLGSWGYCEEAPVAENIWDGTRK